MRRVCVVLSSNFSIKVFARINCVLKNFLKLKLEYLIGCEFRLIEYELVLFFLCVEFVLIRFEDCFIWR